MTSSLPAELPPADPPESLSALMGRVARDLQADHGDVEDTLRAITAAATATVGPADACGISFVTGRRTVQSRAWTSELVRLLDVRQTELGEGPCLDAVWTDQVVLVADLAAEDRWPAFAAQAVAAGARSMLCFQLFVAGDQLGAMNLYASTPDAFDDESVEVGRLLASHAAIALAGARHEEHLRAGMTHRDAIGQAKGILMERYRITAHQAFELLVRSSSLTNRKLHEIAEELTATGQLPTGRPGR